MKKSISSLGKVLNKAEQQTINGGGRRACNGRDAEDRCSGGCPQGSICVEDPGCGGRVCVFNGI